MTRRDAVLTTTAAALAARAAAAGAVPELCRMTARDLAAKLRKKQVSAREVLEAHLQQIEAVNAKHNAIVTLVADRALDRAKQLDEAAAKGRFAGILHGLPIAHKDLVETKGIRTTFGSPIFKDHVPDFNALLIDRIQGAGAVTIGKTNTPEFGAGSQTFNKVFGATRNAHDVTKTCGGSSGGAAVALATNMLPIADGSDMGGSLRNPAAFNGVVGFRVSPGRVPQVPSGSVWNPLSVLGPMGRNVGDVALLLAAIAGPDLRYALSIQEPGEQFLKPLGQKKWKGIRVAWCGGEIPGMPFEPGVREAFAARRKALEATGCIVEDAIPDFAGADEAFRTMRAFGFYQSHNAKLVQHRDQLKATVIEEIERGAKLTVAEIVKAEALRSELCARVGAFLMKYEFFVLPTVQVLPFDVEQEYVREIAGQKMNRYIDWMRSCYYVTMTGLPAISVPCSNNVGMQIVGRPQADLAVLELAHAYEAARGAIA